MGEIRGKQFLIEKYNEDTWSHVAQYLHGGVLFIENCLAECAHWQGGYPRLVQAGAHQIKLLSPFQVGTSDQKKAVFLCRGTALNFKTVKEILNNSYFVNCCIIVTVDSEILKLEQDTTFQDLETAVVDWMQKKPCFVEIVCCPIFCVSITDGLFTTPCFNSLFPKFGESFLPDPTVDLDLYSLPDNEKNEVRRLAFSINCLFEYFNVRDDIFFIGPFASVLAGVLEHLPAANARRKNAGDGVSLIIIDRTLDLCNSTAHNSESLLDKIMSVLPRFPGHSIDVAIDMSLICEASSHALLEDTHLMPGCLAHHENPLCELNLNHFISKSQPEILLSIYDKVSKINSGQVKLPPRVNAQNLEKITSQYKGMYDIIEENSGLLQQTLGIIQTLKSPKMSEIDLLVGVEKQVLQNLTTSRDSTSILSLISNLIKSRKQRQLSLESILALLVHMYSLAGCDISFSESQEKILSDTLSVALFEDQNCLKLSYRDSEKLRSLENCHEFGNILIGRLKEIGKCRQFCQKYKSVIKVNDDLSPSEYKSLVCQLVYDLVDVKKPEIPDLKCRTDGFKDFLRSGLSILMSSSTKKMQNFKHPMDNPLVIFMIIGGTTADECNKIHKAVITSGIDTNILVGSTTLLNPAEAMRKALLLNE